MKAASSRQWLTRGLVAFAALAAAALLPAPAVAQDDQVRVSANWELRPTSNPVHGRDAIGMAVNPRNSRHLVAVYADWASLWCETAVSFNGGRTWRRSRLKAPAGFVSPPCTVGGHLANHVDGTIAFGRGGTVYTTFASAQVDPAGREQARSVLVARSTDGGRTFRTGVVALRGGADPDVGPDYVAPKLDVAPGPPGEPDRVILTAGSTEQNTEGQEDNNAAFTLSNDGGRTWAPRRVLDASGSSIELSQPIIGRGGRLYVAWRTQNPGQRPGQYAPEGDVVVARSADRGATWIEERVAGVRGYTYTGPRTAPFANVQTYTASTFPRLAEDARSGDVYLVYGNGGTPTTPGRARAADHFIHPDIDVWFQRSTNGGSAWSSPKRINDELEVPTEITQTRHPNLSIGPDGRVDIVWHDRRHWYRGCLHTHLPCLEARLGDTYYSFSEDGGRTFSTDRRITDRSINNDVGYDYRFGTYWDYGPVAVPIGRHRLLVAWMDSRNGNVDTDSQGIYLARVDHRPSGRVPAGSIRASDATRLAVGLSQLAYPGGPEAVLGGTFASRPWTRVVIASEDDPAAVLAAGVLARANLSTVLLSPAGGLPEAVKEEILRLQPIGAYVVGGSRALSPRIVDELAGLGVPGEQITRVAGTSRADTARAIAQAVDRRTAGERQQGKPAFDAAILVNPRSAGAYSAAALAAARRLPVLFTGRDAVPAATTAAVEALQIKRVLVVGDEDAIGAGGLRGLPSVQRLGGRTPLNTSRAVLAESLRRGVAANTVFAATRAMDSALLGPAAARIGGLQLLVGRDARSVLKDMRLQGGVDRIVHVRSGGGA